MNIPESASIPLEVSGMTQVGIQPKISRMQSIHSDDFMLNDASNCVAGHLHQTGSYR